MHIHAHTCTHTRAKRCIGNEEKCYDTCFKENFIFPSVRFSAGVGHSCASFLLFLRLSHNSFNQRARINEINMVWVMTRSCRSKWDLINSFVLEKTQSGLHCRVQLFPLLVAHGIFCICCTLRYYPGNVGVHKNSLYKLKTRHRSRLFINCQCLLWTTLLWRHNGRGSVSNHQPHDCLLNLLFRRRSKKTPKLHVTGLCSGNSPETGEFPAQMASNAKNVSIWWHLHETAIKPRDLGYPLVINRVLHVACYSVSFGFRGFTKQPLNSDLG